MGGRVEGSDAPCGPKEATSTGRTHWVDPTREACEGGLWHQQEKRTDPVGQTAVEEVRLAVGRGGRERAYVMPQKKLVLVSGHVVRPVPVVGELKSHENWAFPGAAHRSTAHSRAAAL
jgi:hypothetical protein